MSGQPLVSVCMACHNAERYVGDAVESVLNQTYKNIELIVVNDGSTDRSGAVVEKYKGRGVKVITQENRGQCAAANRALAEARGEYVKFFDADDILSPRFIEAQIGRLAGRKDAVASARWGRFYNDDLKTFRLNPEKVWTDMESTDWLVEATIRAHPMQQCGLWLIPKDVLDKTGGWLVGLSLTNDFEFFCRILCEVKQVLFCEEGTLYYRSGIWGSLSARKSRAARESECRSILLGTAYILKKRQDARAKLACANTCQHLLYDLYPKHPDLRKELAQRVAECGGSKIEPSGGRYFHLLRPWIGWKLARRLQRAVGK
jgi:glycosyltransferase involved in cell wall biosynthesis